MFAQTIWHVDHRSNHIATVGPVTDINYFTDLGYVDKALNDLLSLIEKMKKESGIVISISHKKYGGKKSKIMHVRIADL